MSDVIKFCRGGTPKSNGSNRMAELSTELGPYEFQDATAKELANILSTGTLTQLKEFFLKCHKYDVHIVGSRDFVYRSEKQALLVNYVINGDYRVFQSITRSLDVRPSVVNMVTGERV